MTEKFFFKLPIGDWSGDGHEKVSWFIISSNKPLQDVREAFFKAKDSLDPRLNPENICSEYEENTIPESLVEELNKAGCEFSFDEYDGDVYLDSFSMLDIVLWFLKMGDPDLELQVEENNFPMFPFSGYDKDNRHIGFFGYGLFQ